MTLFYYIIPVYYYMDRRENATRGSMITPYHRN